MNTVTSISTESSDNTAGGSQEFLQWLEDKDEILKLIKAFEFLAQFNHRMEIQQALFGLYCLWLPENDRWSRKLRDITEYPSSTTSRNLAALSDIGIREQAGYRWIKLETDKKQRNRKNIIITQRGMKVRRQLAKIMRGM